MSDASNALSSSLNTQMTDSLSCAFITRNADSKAGFVSSFWVNKPQYTVERISNNLTQMGYTPVSIATGANYATVLDVDTKGYTNITLAIAAGDPNDITYRVQVLAQSTPDVWVGYPNQVDVDVASSDIENMGTAAIITGSFDRIRVQAKQKSSAGRAWASIKATRSS